MPIGPINPGGGGVPTVSGKFGPTALTNGTPTFLTLITPNDGQQHAVYGAAVMNVTSAITGGGLQMTLYQLGVLQTVQLCASSGASQVANGLAADGYAADPNTVVTLSQIAALTAGAATVTANVQIV